MKYFPILFLIILSSCKPVSNRQVYIFSAVGASAPLEEIVRQYEDREGIEIAAHYGSSGTLGAQIGRGAQADIFISADKKWIDFLRKKDLLTDSTITALCANRLALIASEKGLISRIEFTEDFNLDYFSGKTIAIGDPNYVPAGKYAKQALESLGWYASLKDRLIFAKDVTAALRYVELGEADIGIVYSTESAKSRRIPEQKLIPAQLHEPIVFYAALTGVAHEQAGKLFQRIVEARSVFERHGFSAL